MGQLIDFVDWITKVEPLRSSRKFGYIDGLREFLNVRFCGRDWMAGELSADTFRVREAALERERADLSGF